MNCPRCRRSVPPDARLCCYCGKRLADCEAPQRRRHRRPRGTGTVWKDPRNKNRPYVAVAADGTRIGSFATAGDAVQTLDRVNASQAAPERLCYTLSDVYDRWSVLHYPKISKSAQQSYRNAYNKAEPLHRRRIAELKTEDYQTIIQQIAETEKFDLVLYEFFYASPKVDITDRVMKALDADVKPAKKKK